MATKSMSPEEMMAMILALQEKNAKAEEAFARVAELDETEAKKKAEEEAKAEEAERAERKSIRDHEAYLETAGYADARVAWEKAQAEADGLKEVMDDIFNASPHKAKAKGVKKPRLTGEARVKQDKKLSNNNTDEKVLTNIFCKFGNGINGTAEPKYGGIEIKGCKKCYRNTKTMARHEAECKWATKPRPWENK